MCVCVCVCVCVFVCVLNLKICLNVLFCFCICECFMTHPKLLKIPLDRIRYDFLFTLFLCSDMHLHSIALENICLSHEMRKCECV